ncbi:MAG: FAD-binding oxidoreductase [Acidobacteria bacterium]|nr:FAD-binding oxidoreductase [Acidobacteriota bacterium]
MKPDVLIVGAGIVGSACAWELSQLGLRVLVIEDEAVGGGATAAGMGHLVVLDGSEAEFELSAASLRLWDQFVARMPEGVEYSRCGTLWVAADQEEMAEAQRKHNFCAAHGVRSEMLDPVQLAETEPNLCPGLAGGLVLPDDGILFAPVAAQWMIRDSKAELLRATVARLEGRRAILADGTVIEAGITVNAAGARAPHITPGIPVTPRKGQLVITDRYPGFIRHEIVELGYLKLAHAASGESVAFNVQPRKNGQVLVGSSRQHGVKTHEIDRHMLERMLRRAIEYLPALPQLAAIRCWTGLRPATPDGRALVGPWPAQPGMYLATGHEGLGITAATATGRLIADYVANRPPIFDATAFLPERCFHA